MSLQCRLREESVSAEARVRRMRTASPAWIPQRHLVEGVLNPAAEQQDCQPIEELLDVVTRCMRTDRISGRCPMPCHAMPHRPDERFKHTF